MDTQVRDALVPSHGRSGLEEATLRAVTWRVISFLFVLYVVSFLDRVNVGFAALDMNCDLKLGPAVYGFGAGIFFIGSPYLKFPATWSSPA